MASLQKFDYFFELPGELREQILSYLVIEPGGIIIGQRGEWSQGIAHEFGQPQERRRRRGADGSLSSDDDDSDEEDDYGDQFTKKPRWPLNYFLVSQTFHREVTSIYFRENTFYLLATGRKTVARQPARGHHVVRRATWMLGSPRRFTGEGSEGGEDANFPGPCERLLGDPRYRDSRRRMRNIVIYVKALRGILVEGVFRPLGDMVLTGGLKHLEIRVWWFQAKGSGMLSSVPMQAMYRVLKDPDLESARLKVVEGHHEVVWCPFHAGRSKPNSLCDTGLGKRGRSVGPPGRNGVKWVEIGLHGLVGRYGEVEEALRILKVGD